MKKIAVLIILCFLTPLLSRCAGENVEKSPGAKESEMKTVPLPEPSKKGPISLEECIEKRRSRRSFTDRELTREELSQLLWAAQGITDETRNFRAAPSAGATYPLELFVVAPDGVWRYEPKGHVIKKMKDGDLREELAAASLGQSSVAQGAASVVICADYERTTGRYGDRGVMYVHMEAGHVAQNLHLQAVSLGLDSVPVGAFRPEKLRSVIGADEALVPIYVIPIGEAAK